MKQLLALFLCLTLFTSTALANVIVKSGPTLTEINDGYQACQNGEARYDEGGNCKYWSYPGVVRVSDNGLKTSPADPTYILRDVLEPGTVLPKVTDAEALLAAIKKSKVTIVSFYMKDTILLASLDAGQFLTDYVSSIIVPEEVVELAEQNGIEPEEMYIYIKEGVGETPQEIIDDITAQTDLVSAILQAEIEGLNAQIDGLNAQIEDLQNTIKSLEEQNIDLSNTIKILEDQITVLQSDFDNKLLELFKNNKDLQQQLDLKINEIASQAEKIKELDEQIKAKDQKIAELEAEIDDWEVMDVGILNAQITDLNDEIETLKDEKQILTDKINDALAVSQNITAPTVLDENIDEYSYEGETPGTVITVNDIASDAIGESGSYISGEDPSLLLQDVLNNTELKAALIVSIANKITQSYNDGYQDGYTAGYEDGYAQGVEDTQNAL